MAYRIFFSLLALVSLVPSTAAAQDVEGSWALKMEGAAIFRFDIAGEGAEWRGVWTRPLAVNSDGDRFGGFSRQAVEVDSAAGSTVGDWAELTFTDPRPNAIPDVFRFRRIDDNQVEMIYGGTGWTPYVLEKVPAGTPLGPFEIGRTYVREGELPKPGPLPVLFSSPDADIPVAEPVAAQAPLVLPKPAREEKKEQPAIVGR